MLGKRTMIFIDAQNLHFGQMNYFEDDDYDMDFVKLRDKLGEGRDVIRSYWFDSYPTQEQIDEVNEDDENPRTMKSKEGFFYFLQMNGFRVDAKPLRKRDGKFVEKGADIGLATELVAQGFNDSFEVAIVVTGDSDFERSIRYVQNQGKIVEVASFDSQIGSEFKAVADEFYLLDDWADELER